MHCFPEFPVGFPEILLILTNLTIPSEKLAYAYVSRFFPLGNLRSLPIPVLPGKLVKISDGKNREKREKLRGKNWKLGKIKKQNLAVVLTWKTAWSTVKSYTIWAEQKFARRYDRTHWQWSDISWPLTSINCFSSPIISLLHERYFEHVFGTARSNGFPPVNCFSRDLPAGILPLPRFSHWGFSNFPEFPMGDFYSPHVSVEKIENLLIFTYTCKSQ